MHLFRNCHIFFKPAIKITHQGRASGGVIVLVKKYLSKVFEITQVDHNFTNIVCLNICVPSSIGKVRRLFFVSTYIPPYGSPLYEFLDVENGFSILDSFMNFLNSMFSDFNLILCGDFNARIKNIQPLTDSDNTLRFADITNYFDYHSIDDLNRVSKDTTMNMFGRYLYELCCTFNLLILNGLLENDKPGAFTFISNIGQSTIDYFLVTDSILNYCSNFSVLDDPTSLHQPIALSFNALCYFKINTDLQSLANEQTHVTKFVWDDSKQDEFVSNLDIYLNTDFMSTFTANVNDNINNAVTNLSSVMTISAECMKQSFFKSRSLFNVNKGWYDNDCAVLKRTVKKYLRVYKNNSSEANRNNYITKRNEYSSFIKFKKYMFSINKLSNIRNYSLKHNSALFWSEIRSVISKNNNVTNNIKLCDWYSHFKSVFQFDTPLPSICNEVNTIYFYCDTSLETLNSPILQQEIQNAINFLKSNKSPGPDSILNEMLLCSKDKFIPLLSTIFSALFSSNSFIDAWQKTIISPVFKKGNPELCSNYRPISLTSLLSKVYISILNKRLTEYVEHLNIIPEEQAAFRQSYSTIDHVFSLYTIISKQFSCNRKLYVAFIDYKKAFDSIRREALYVVLERNGIKGQFLNAIKALYSHVFSAVRCENNVSEYFECPVGLKQGCVLSPLLFNIFVSEISKYLNLNGLHGIQLIPNGNILHHLLYADDNCIFSSTPRGLQSKLNSIYFLSLKLGLEVNLDKTKIMVFRKGGYLGRNEKWFYNNEPVEVVNQYNYLGITFTTRLSFVNTLMPLIAKSKKSINEILFSLRSLSCSDLKLFTQLFDSKVFPILSYGCELWGVFDIYDVERVHLYALKRYLNVSLHCSNKKVYSETGRYPLSINHKVRCVKFWLKINKYDRKRLVNQSYLCLLNLSKKGYNNWVTNVRDVLCSNGYGVVWLMGEVGNTDLFLSTLKTTLIDNFYQDLEARMTADVNCSWYFGIKPLFSSESYLSNLNIKICLRNVLIKFRLGVSQINCHKYTYSKCDTLKLCPFCVRTNNENENHVLFECPLYNEYRHEFLSTRPYTYDELINCKYKLKYFISNNNYMIARYLLKCFHKRSSLLQLRSI